jgi:hypothetical protein
MDPELAVKDFLERIDGYKASYNTINDSSLSYIKTVNVGEQIIVNRIK